MKQRNTSAYAPHAKRHRTLAANSRRNSDSEDYTEKSDHTPLTKADTHDRRRCPQ